MSNSLVLLDESGDLGWIFDQPYRAGGSSRYFTIAAAMGVNNSHRQFGKVVQHLYKTHKWTSRHEKKWTSLGRGAKIDFANKVVALCKDRSDVHLLVSVIDKMRVPQQMHDHYHLLYSWISSNLIAASARTHRQISICPDDLNAGSGSQSLIENMLRNELWFTLRAKTEVNRIPRSKALEDGLSFCDFLAGAVQSHFEDSQSEPFNILSPYIFLHYPW